MTRRCKAKNKDKRFVLKHIYGDCLEKAGLYIPHEGYAIIDKNARIKVGDLVHCNNAFTTINGFIKQVKDINGNSVIVGTAYLDSTRDYSFEAAEIYGVVTEAYCKVFGNRIYVRH